MQPHLLCVNLNGMIKDGDRGGHKILHLAEGDSELGLMKVIRDSGWFGPVGIIDHRNPPIPRHWPKCKVVTQSLPASAFIAPSKNI